MVAEPLSLFDPAFDPLGGSAGEAERARRAQALDEARRWVDPRGYRLSDRLWYARQLVREGIDDVLRQGIARGWGAERTAQALRGYLLDPHRGLAPALRLARTETMRAHGEATKRNAEANPFVEAVAWRTSGGHTHADVCDGNARNGPYKPGEVPSYPGHPNCRCVLVPVVTEDTDAVVDDLRRRLGLER